MRKKVQIDIGNKIIKRVIKILPYGNFQMNIIRYMGEFYFIGDGDEYLRGYDKVFTLGRKLIR